MSLTGLAHGASISKKAWDANLSEIFNEELLGLLKHLHQKFEPRRKELLRDRSTRQKEWNEGSLPTYLDKNSKAVTSNWKVTPAPKDFRVRRVEITGPVNDPKMVINMLSRNSEGHRADTAMLDFEDSMKPSFDNVINGYKNVISAAHGNLRVNSKGKLYELDPDDMAGLMVRVRGLHLTESNLRFDNVPIHAGMLDLATCFYHTAKVLKSKNKTPKYYIPKCEHHNEAKWWSDLFKELEAKLKMPTPTLRATFLIETLPAAFQVEEILFEAKEHITGLNVGRWDKIFSDIKVMRNHPDRISPDRAEINMNKFWMDNYAKRLIKICHSRGAYAIGGMSAFTPGKQDAVRAAQTEKVRADKQNEFDIGHDGCWVSHPYFIGHALSAFTQNDQLDRLLEHQEKFPDLLMDGKGTRSIDGLRTNIRVGIAYMEGWLRDLGCVAWDNMMEDLATLEISRAQTWQWLKHEIILDDGHQVTKELVRSIFDQELEKIHLEIKNNMTNSQEEEINLVIAKFGRAMEEARELFLENELREFISVESDLY